MAIGVQTDMATPALARFGSDEVRKEFLAPSISGEYVACLGVSEVGAGSDVASIKTTARKDGDDYILNGQKTFITNGPHADTIVFICKLDEGNPPEERKIVQFVLDSGMPGLEQSKPLRKMGIHSSPTGQLFLDDVRVGMDRLLGESLEAYGGKGGREASKATFSMERAGVAAMALGIVDRCMELSVAYANDRVQFGQPIGEFQLVQGKVADMYVTLNACRAYVYAVAKACDRGETTREDAAGAILYAAEKATQVALDAIQLLGGNGYINDYPTGRLWRDAKLYEIGAGTSEIRRMLIGRELFAETA
jgi:alkylation response protein AidB-like acyl-CoA dehydrogenase